VNSKVYKVYEVLRLIKKYYIIIAKQKTNLDNIYIKKIVNSKVKKRSKNKSQDNQQSA